MEDKILTEEELLAYIKENKLDEVVPSEDGDDSNE